MDMDRLSSLPDEVICHILSFLRRTKPCVQTSVLSKRWRFLWTFVPFLGFEGDDTRRADIITNIVLQQHKHVIHTFSIAIEDNDDEFEQEFQSWISNVTTRNIRKLVVVVPGYGDVLKLPQCLFTCRTLVDLSLKGCGDVPVSGIYFPALKKLKLYRVQFISHEFLPQLISSCPVLEELSIMYVLLGGYCCVSSPTLTKLVLQLGVFFSDIWVDLDTPSLRYLRLFTSTCGDVSVGALDSLIEADIYSCNVLAFVGRLHNVKLLSLDIYDIPVINESAFFASDIKFHNLTKLNLSADRLCYIAFFLENANNLRVLKFRIYEKEDGDDDDCGWKEPEQVPACLRSHLQTVELDLSCLGSFEEHVFEMVRYILVNAKVLKMIKVPKRWGCDKKLETFKRDVALFERGSQECELVFDWDGSSLYERYYVGID